jgi:hypothetical protein
MLLLWVFILLLGETQPRVQRCSNSIATRCQIRSRRKRLAVAITRRSLLARGRRCHDALGGKDMLVSASIARRRGNGSSSGIWSCDKSEATRTCSTGILVLARAPTPVQTNGVIARLAHLDTVLTCRLLLATFHLTRFAWPASCATALLGLTSTLLLRSRHPTPGVSRLFL